MHRTALHPTPNVQLLRTMAAPITALPTTGPGRLPRSLWRGAALPRPPSVRTASSHGRSRRVARSHTPSVHAAGAAAPRVVGSALQIMCYRAIADPRDTETRVSDAATIARV